MLNRYPAGQRANREKEDCKTATNRAVIGSWPFRRRQEPIAAKFVAFGFLTGRVSIDEYPFSKIVSQSRKEFVCACQLITRVYAR